MCTITFIARSNGYVLGMNRDEKLTRALGLPPTRGRLRDRQVLFPSESSGGTWIGVNDTGATLALINWYSVDARVSRRAISRGQVVKDALAYGSPESLNAALEDLPLAQVNPFRLIGIFPTDTSVIEWRWNLKRIVRLAHDWRTNTWISSGFDEPGARRIRSEIYRQALNQISAGELDWLRRLHRSHCPEQGPYSHCMHREDAATVSYTEITVSRQEASLRYTAGAPCCSRPSHELRLKRRPSRER